MNFALPRQSIAACEMLLSRALLRWVRADENDLLGVRLVYCLAVENVSFFFGGGCLHE